MRLNKRGRIVRALLIGAGIALALWFTSTRLWFTGEGYCVGSMVKCIGGL
jgi:hypothetical protein